MRTLMLALALLGTASGAWADPSDLSGGVLIAHHVAPYIFCVDPCTDYGGYAIYDLSEVVNQLSGGGDVWYVLAAWETEAKTWCGAEFGFGGFDLIPFVFYGSGVCYPGTGLEIPTPGWPGPNEGTAFVTTGAPWSGNWLPLYWFYGYTYGYTYGATVIPISVDPPTNFCGFSNCMNPPMSFSVGAPQRGRMGVNMPGYTPVFPAETQWACCFTSEPYCRMMFEQECLLAGGVWLGPEYTCEPDPCEQPGACCTAGFCEFLFEQNCLLVGGTFLGAGTLCEPNPCPAVCCYGPTWQHCMITLQADCEAIQGYWHPEWTSCEPNPCISSPTRYTSWGRIKSMYR
jgi:hypothetical protein